jgi:predicted phosphodiesterase
MSEGARFVGNLKDHLAVPQTEQPTPSFGYRAATEYNGSTGYIQTAPITKPPVFDELLESFGYDPKEVRILGPLKTSRWQQREDGEWLYSYRFALAPASTSNIDELVSLINKRKISKPPVTDNSMPFHWLAGDLQLGKIDGDGTQGIVDRVCQSIERGVLEYKRIRKFRPIGVVHQAWLGDCMEGNQSQNGKNMWRTELTITEQYRLFRRLMLYAVDQFAPLVERLEIDVVNGNHDEAQRSPVSTRADDGHATEAAIALADALELNESSYGHVKIFVPNKDESMITREIGDSIFTHLHGHQVARGKSFDWWGKQALNFQSAGAAQFLLRGHEHEFRVHTKRDRTEICVPTFESRSQYWVDRHGDIARTGALVMVTEGENFMDLAIV